MTQNTKSNWPAVNKKHLGTQGPGQSPVLLLIIQPGKITVWQERFYLLNFKHIKVQMNACSGLLRELHMQNAGIYMGIAQHGSAVSF